MIQRKNFDKPNTWFIEVFCLLSQPTIVQPKSQNFRRSKSAMSELIEALSQQQNALFEERKRKLFKVIQEGGNAFQGRFVLAFNLYLELDARLADASQVLDAFQPRHQTNARIHEYRASEAHFVHTVVHHHLQIMHLNGLVPHVWQQRKCKVSVRNCGLVSTFFRRTLRIYVYPLMV